MRQAGFTLMEAMIVVSIIAIILAIATPSYQAMIRDSRLVAASEELLTSLMLARTEAIKRNRAVVICNSANPTASNPACITANPNWATGWIIFATNGSGTNYDRANDTLIRVGNQVEGVDRLGVNNNITRIRFHSMINASAQTVDFEFCITGRKKRVVSVDKTGRVSRSQQDTCTG
ncbi:GspH/FimT family pseudopilin [Chitiniphilus purpureus]|uniref:Type II secretion system protein H n=1 Tax=Chitiniphilus purpureus TaxID=2981137 RepID=A0ABY6DMR1_9NEIS|nr:GspH/FimT family pseudopilin [Chitiniphilus sp. CD1]UXY15652.1 GspH/FimT family pseudopilin [Chitiniphilus sp. CD1]